MRIYVVTEKPLLITAPSKSGGSVLRINICGENPPPSPSPKTVTGQFSP